MKRGAGLLRGAGVTAGSGVTCCLLERSSDARERRFERFSHLGKAYVSQTFAEPNFLTYLPTYL